MARPRKKEAATESSETQAAEPASTTASETPSTNAEVGHTERSESSEQGNGSWVSRTQGEATQPSEAEARSRYPDPNVPFSLAHNNKAGIRFLKSDRFKQVQLAFNTPPADDIHHQLVSEGWTFRRDEQVYTRQYGPEGEGAALIDGKRTYNAIVSEILARTGASPDISR
jgi:hypothetical protein